MGYQGTELQVHHQSDLGASAVEIALVLPFVALLLVGMIQFGLVFDKQLELQHAARIGVREYALTHDANDGETAARAAATRIDAADLTVSTTACTPGSPTSLTVESSHDLRIPFFNNDTLNLSATASMRCTGPAP